MKINWKSSHEGNRPTPLNLINLEYAVELQVIMILIKEAEHLMEYKSLIILDVDSKDSVVSINEETPEPLYSILQRNFDRFHSKVEEALSIHEKTEQPSFVSI